MTEATPIVRYLILCDEVQTDPQFPLRASLIGLLATIRSVEDPAYPLLYREFCVFVQLTSCRGPGDGWIRIEQSDTDQEVFRTRTRTLPLGTDPLELLAISFRIRDCVFPAAGLYWVQFWYNGQMLAQQPLLLR